MQVLLGLSILPTILIMLYIRKKEYHDKEPGGLLALLFILGAVPSVIAAMILEFLGEGIIKWIGIFPQGTFLYYFFDAFLVVALAEEGCKFLSMYIASWNNKNFDYKYDGIVYAVFTSLGFATIENIMYVFMSGGGGLKVALLRAVLSVPGHAEFGIFMGYFYGMAKMHFVKGNTKECNRYKILALLVPIGIHGFYDFCLFLENWLATALFVVFVITIDVLAIIRVNRSAKEDDYFFTQFILQANGRPMKVEKGYQLAYLGGQYTQVKNPNMGQSAMDGIAALNRSGYSVSGTVPQGSMADPMQQAYMQQQYMRQLSQNGYAVYTTNNYGGYRINGNGMPYGVGQQAYPQGGIYTGQRPTAGVNGQQYGSQSAYGRQAGYGQPQGQYGRAQTGYGQPQGQYGRPQAGYGQPQGQYGRAQAGYGQPQGQYGRAQAGYGQPQGQYGRAQAGYGQQGRPQGYGQPTGRAQMSDVIPRTMAMIAPTPPKFIYCPSCGGITPINSFSCRNCGKPLNAR